VPSPLGSFAQKVKMATTSCRVHTTGAQHLVWEPEFLGKAPLGGEGQGEGTVRDAGSSTFKVQSSKAKAGRATFALPWAVAGLVLLAAIAIATRYWSSPPPSTQHPAPDTQSPTPNPQPLPLPDKPSLIVLPFINMS